MDTVASRRVFLAVRKGTAMLDPTVISPAGRDRPPRPLLRTMLGDALRRTRQEQGRTLADVARVARVSMPYLSEVERGRKEASSEVLAAICDSLGIDLAELLAEVWHDLADLRIRRGRFERAERVVQLDAIPGRRPGPPQQHGPAAPQCLLAA
jgi:transcriptional regulator with XRE-family HTH domain